MMLSSFSSMSDPLKFLFNFSITGVLFGGPAQSLIMTRAKFSTLLVIYGTSELTGAVRHS